MKLKDSGLLPKKKELRGRGQVSIEGVERYSQVIDEIGEIDMPEPLERLDEVEMVYFIDSLVKDILKAQWLAKAIC